MLTTTTAVEKLPRLREEEETLKRVLVATGMQLSAAARLWPLAAGCGGLPAAPGNGAEPL